MKHPSYWQGLRKLLGMIALSAAFVATAQPAAAPDRSWMLQTGSSSISQFTHLAGKMPGVGV